MSNDKLHIKQSVLKAAIDKQSELIENFSKRLKDMRGGEKFINETQFDAQQASFNNELNEQMEGIAGQMSFAEDEMSILKHLENSLKLQDEVRVGSVVITDKMNFFVAVSSEDIEAHGKPYFGISTKAPIFSAMAGKKTGDTFKMNEMSYQIKDVF
jgi:transcription elongation GreA/GreB family factor